MPLANQGLDAVSRYLASVGIPTTTAYFANSGFESGRALQTPHLSLVFRLEGSVLLICDLKAQQAPTGVRSAVSEFIALIQQLERQVPVVQEVRGLLRSTGSAAEQQLRAKLAVALKKRGATSTQIDGDSWLVYPCKRGHEPNLVTN